MKSRMHLVVALVFCLTVAGNPGYASDLNSKKTENPYSSGKGPIISGILVTTLGGGAGSFLFLWGVADRFTPLQSIGLGVVALSVGAGVPLIVYGASQRSKWKKFEASHTEMEHYITRKLTKRPERYGQPIVNEQKSISFPVLAVSI